MKALLHFPHVTLTVGVAGKIPYRISLQLVVLEYIVVFGRPLTLLHWVHLAELAEVGTALALGTLVRAFYPSVKIAANSDSIFKALTLQHAPHDILEEDRAIRAIIILLAGAKTAKARTCARTAMLRGLSTKVKQTFIRFSNDYILRLRDSPSHILATALIAFEHIDY